MSDLHAAVRAVVEAALEALDVTLDEVAFSKAIGQPKNPDFGDVAFACFPLARLLRKAPPAIAADLAGRLAPLVEASTMLASCEAVGPYINFRSDRGAFARELFPRAIAGELGRSDVGSGKTICIDFSSPNVAKPFGIGHLRSTAIGAAIGRIYASLGYEVVGINHIGDWGTQFGKLISAWLRWGDEAAFVERPILHLYDLYVRFHNAEKADPNLTQDARDWFRRLEEGDEEARVLWTRFREASLGEFNRIYERMGVSFSVTWGEAFYEDKLEAAVARIRETGVLEESEGAMVVRVDEIYPNTSPCLVLRSDGASLYATRDLTAAMYRHEQFKFDRSIYVTGADQADHFRKVFGSLKRMGLPWADRCAHVPFGRIHGISTRKGTLVFLEDVFDRARDLSLGKMHDTEMSPEDRALEAEKIGIGAVVFFDLSKERIKDANFDWDAILQISGRTGPGLQYTQVRLKSLARKYEKRYGALPDPAAVDYGLLDEPLCSQMINAISQYDAIVARAADQYEPAIVSRFLLDLADMFNTYYSSGKKIVSEDAPLSAARITLCRAVLAVLLHGLAMLGVPVPDRM